MAMDTRIPRGALLKFHKRFTNRLEGINPGVGKQNRVLDCALPVVGPDIKDVPYFKFPRESLQVSRKINPVREIARDWPAQGCREATSHFLAK